jgi:poly-gamma-glutamate capsule biosynthesis protein CapA/YwtB (metallophosphatase superfamily)
VVVAAFHWGDELATRPSARQVALAKVALDAGATAVIGAHPHVLQPVVRSGRRVVAYSLGNFVFPAGSPGTTRTGILELRLGAGRVLSHRFRPASIRGATPVLR